MKYLKLVLPVMLLVLSGSLKASVVSSDFYNDGSLDWLHFDTAYGMSDTDALNTFSGDGFRLATAPEAFTLMNTWFGASFSLVHTSADRDGYSALADRFVEEFGSTVRPGISLGHVATLTFGPNFRRILAGLGTINLSASSVMLVREAGPISAVPVPAAAWLFGSALLGFFGVARRKARA